MNDWSDLKKEEPQKTANSSTKNVLNKTGFKRRRFGICQAKANNIFQSGFNNEQLDAD